MAKQFNARRITRKKNGDIVYEGKAIKFDSLCAVQEYAKRNKKCLMIKGKRSLYIRSNKNVIDMG
jgi:hypothetical protein